MSKDKFYMSGTGSSTLTTEELENIERLKKKLNSGPQPMDTKRMASFLQEKLNHDTMISIPKEWESMDVEPGERRFTTIQSKIDNKTGLFTVADFMMNDTEGMKMFKFVKIHKVGKNCTVKPGDIVLIRLSAPLMLAIETPEVVVYQFMENQIESFLIPKEAKFDYENTSVSHG
jgi:hypothetical protein